jgi:hypothetical protein
MKTKVLSIALIGIFALAISGWTLMDAPKKIIYSDKYNYTYTNTWTLWNPCSGEWVNYEGEVHRSGKLTIWDDGKFHDKWHVNYHGITGIGLTSGDAYNVTGAANGHLNGNVGANQTIVDHFNIIHHGGPNYKYNFHMHWTVNADGDITNWWTDFTADCN